MSKKHDGCPVCGGSGILSVSKTFHPDGRVKTKTVNRCPA